MLEIVLLAYSQGIAAACARNVQFIAISGDSQPSHAHIAKFVVSLSDQIQPLFAQVLMTCDAQGLFGREMFAIDGVKLPSNVSKERSGTQEELRHRAERLDKAADKILALHQAQDKAGAQEPLDAKRQARVEALREEAARTRAFVTQNPKRLNAKGQELKSNVTDPDSAKMATNKGVIQGYAAQAAVDSAHQLIIAADVVGSGSEQATLAPMIEQAKPWSDGNTLVIADAGYRSLVGPHLYEPHRLIESRGYFGLTWEGALHYGTLRDDEGHLYSLTRRFCDTTKGGRDSLIIQSTRNAEGCQHFDLALFKGSATGKDVVTGIDGDSAYCRSPPNPDGAPYEIIYGPDSLRWLEDGLMSLTGRLCGPGLRWYL